VAKLAAAETRASVREESKKRRLEEEEKQAQKRRQREKDLVKRREERERAKQERDSFGRLASKKFTSGVCSVRARVNDEREGVEWYGCDRGDGCKVGGWFHMVCLPESEQESLRASLVSGDEWVCAFCMEE